VRRRRWALVAGTGILVHLAIALAIWRIFWLADAGYRHLAANAVATTAHVTVDATTYSRHGAFCYSYSVGEPTYQIYSGCGEDEHPDPVTWPAVGTPIAAIYDRQHPDVSCLCTTDHLTWDQKVTEVAWAIGLTGILAFAVLAYLVFDVLNGYRSRSVYTLVAWLRYGSPDPAAHVRGRGARVEGSHARPTRSDGAAHTAISDAVGASGTIS